jgi:hypothetical protein
MVREPEPASWLEGYTLPENPTFGQKLRGFEPVYPWDRPRPIPRENHDQYHRLKLTGAAVFRGATSPLVCGPRNFAGTLGGDPKNHGA